MQHRIPIDELGPNAQGMGDAVTACVHCGFCLPTCPTYQVLGEEMDSPRGRIYLMKGVLEGTLDESEVKPHLDRCLGCMACETSCPSGVQYHKLLLPYRAKARSTEARSAMDRFRQWVIMQTLPYPGRFRMAVKSAGWTRWLHPLAPKAFRPMMDLLPSKLPPVQEMPAHSPAMGTRRARVAMLTGCVQRALNPDINRATIDVLTRNGVEVVVPEGQGCCGALAWHSGEAGTARRFARDILRVFPKDVDAIVLNAAGCGSGMKEYPLILAGESEEGEGRALADQVVDVSVFLNRLGIEPPPALSRPVRVAYHDACHLSHAQQVRSEPRQVLRSVEGLEVLELNDGERCCGSAGTYNVEQPEIAEELGRMKAGVVRATGCDLIATGNIGCMVQMQRHLAGDGVGNPPRVLHTMEVLSLAYAGKLEP